MNTIIIMINFHNTLEMKTFMDQHTFPNLHSIMNVIVFVGIFQDGLSELILITISYKNIILIIVIWKTTMMNFKKNIQIILIVKIS